MRSFQVARKVVSHHYSGEFVQSQAANHWQGPFPLPKALILYYLEFGPLDMEWKFLPKPFYFPSLRELWQYQVGFGFDPNLKKLRPGWQPHWITIADNDDTLIIYCMRTGQVLIDFEGEGQWSPQPLFSDLESMVNVFCVLSDICHCAGINFEDNDFCHKSVPLNLRETAFIRLVDLTGELESARSILGLLGWY